MELSLKKILIALAVVVIGVAGYVYTTDYLGQKTGGEYNKLRDLSSAYNATEEIKTAKERTLQGVQAATVITQGKTQAKECALTFDGLADITTTERILDLLNKYQAKGTFFVEGINVAEDPKKLTTIVEAGQKVGNYTYVGLAHLEKAPDAKVLDELCTTQKVLKITTDFTPTLFKSPSNIYSSKLLQLVTAAGLKYAVQSLAQLEPSQLLTQEAATAFVKTLQPGAILSLRLGESTELRQEKGKIDERPAIDKQPGLETLPQPTQSTNKLAALEKVLIALKAEKYQVVFVENFAQEGKAKPLQVSLWQKAKDFILANCAMSTAYAAAPATEEKMLYTASPIVPFTFTGLAKENSVRNVLKALRENKATGTFFVTQEEIKKHDALIRDIKAQGHELAITLRPKASEGYAQIKKSLVTTHNLLLQNYGVNTKLVRQFSGVIKPETKQAISDLGYRLIGQTVNVVQTRHQKAKTSDEVMKDIFGSKVYSVGRGWIIQIRMDYYENENLAADMFRAIKKNKIDNIAYRSYYDAPETNPHNDSSYQIKGVGAALKNTWVYPVPYERILPSMQPTNLLEDTSNAALMRAMKKRYIGFKWVNEDDRMLGFSTVEAKQIDQSGRIHTNDPVIFFTFDDWGTDASVNKLLYVFRKHGVKGNFFVLTHNVPNNPNLLRAIALEGHDICAHSNMHMPMAVRKNNSSRQYPTQTPQEMNEDAKTCYERLLSITGDIDYQGKPVLTKYYRTPTLAISKEGMKALFSNGYEYVVAGAASTEDYSAEGLKTMLHRLTDAIYLRGKVRKGSALVMHMSDTSQYTALALDMLLTANAKRAADDPAKFTVGKLSDYLTPDYDQGKPFVYR